MICPCFAMYYLVAFHFCNHLAEEEITDCLTLIVFLLALLIVFGALLFLTVPCVGLQCAIVQFPGHTYLYFEVSLKMICFLFLFKILFNYSLLSYTY